MITLVSYPRSGNTFLRNVLFEVYGIASKTYLTDAHGPDLDWESAEVVKTHHLPAELPQKLRERKIVYLLRDGRDAAVSFAHHREDIVAPESTFDQNLQEVTYAAEGSHFGGWSKHVEEWLTKADLVIRFEELIADPLAVCKRLKAVMSLPQANPAKLPDFETLRSGTPEYGSGKYSHDGQLAKRWFRKGKVGSWKEEMSSQQAELFWHLHGETMEHVGYALNGEIKPPDLSSCVPPKTIFIEATKLEDRFIDGIGRYVRAMIIAAHRFPITGLEVRVIAAEKILSLEQALSYLPSAPITGWFHLAKHAAHLILPRSMYEWLSRTIPRPLKRTQGNTSTKDHIQTVLLTLPQNARFLAPFHPKRVVTVIHDLTHRLFSDLHEPHNVTLSEEGLAWTKQHDHSFIAVSESTRRDLEKSGEEATVIHEGVDRRTFFPIPNEHLKGLVRERYGLPDGHFLLSVATLEPRKNLQRLIDAYARLDEQLRKQFPLVLAGRKGWRSKISIPPNCSGRVHFTGFVREDHLPALYTLAHGFCYISLYEGFGLPVLEAMACGCPVLISDRASLPEVAGEAGIQCDPEDEESIAQGLVKLMRTDRDEKGKECMRRSWNFTWRESWMQTAARLME